MTLKLRQIAIACAAVTFAGASAGFAAAQPYGDDNRNGYDQRQDQQQYNQAQYDEQRRSYDGQYGDGAYDRYQHDQDRAARHECHREKNGSAAAGAVLGGIAGAVIGSNVAHGGGRTGGAVIGGVGGAAVGSSIARGETKC